jgi:hypothetical protein
MNTELNGISPIPFFRKRGDSGSLRSQDIEEAALGRPGGQP